SRGGPFAQLAVTGVCESRAVVNSERGLLKGLGEVDWAELGHAYGRAQNVPGQLTALCGRDEAACDSALRALFSNIFHQGPDTPRHRTRCPSWPGSPWAARTRYETGCGGCRPDSRSTGTTNTTFPAASKSRPGARQPPN